MTDEKATNLAAISLRRRIAVRDLALAASYPQSQPATNPLPLSTPSVQSLEKRRRDYPSPAENVAKPWKKPWDK